LAFRPSHLWSDPAGLESPPNTAVEPFTMFATDPISCANWTLVLPARLT
jgi:hypothetical protein